METISLKKISLFFPVVFLLLGGCDYISNPHSAGTTPGGPTSGVTRRILVEEFTGHLCTNCPTAARTLHTIDSIHAGQIIPIAIHCGYFANTCPPNPLPNGQAPLGSYSENFQTPGNEGTDYDNTFSSMSSSPPAGLINRLGFPSDYRKEVAQWSTMIDSLLNTPAVADLKFDTVIYNSTTRDLSLTVSGKFIAAQNGTFNLAVMLVEDSLTGWQLDNGVNIQNYNFMHVLRACVNSPGSIAGTQIAAGNIDANSNITPWSLSPAYNVNAGWNAAHCKLVAFIYNTSTMEVLQSAEHDLQ